MSAFSFSISAGISAAFISSPAFFLPVMPIVLFTSFIIVLGTMPCALLYSSCILRRRLVSSIALFMLPVMVSAYMMTLPSAFRAARPIVCTSEVSLRKKPSLSASRMATNFTSGRSSPSRSRFMPQSTSNSPLLKPFMISILSSASMSLCMYLTFKECSFK